MLGCLHPKQSLQNKYQDRGLKTPVCALHLILYFLSAQVTLAAARELAAPSGLVPHGLQEALPWHRLVPYPHTQATSCLLLGFLCLRNLPHWHPLPGEGGWSQTKCQDWGCVAKDIKARPWLLQKPSKLLSTLTYSYYSIAQTIIKVPALRNCSCKLRTVQ